MDAPVPPPGDAALKEVIARIAAIGQQYANTAYTDTEKRMRNYDTRKVLTEIGVLYPNEEKPKFARFESLFGVVEDRFAFLSWVLKTAFMKACYILRSSCNPRLPVSVITFVPAPSDLEVALPNEFLYAHGDTCYRLLFYTPELTFMDTREELLEFGSAMLWVAELLPLLTQFEGFNLAESDLSQVRTMAYGLLGPMSPELETAYELVATPVRMAVPAGVVPTRASHELPTMPCLPGQEWMEPVVVGPNAAGEMRQKLDGKRTGLGTQIPRIITARRLLVNNMTGLEKAAVHARREAMQVQAEAAKAVYEGQVRAARAVHNLGRSLEPGCLAWRSNEVADATFRRLRDAYKVDFCGLDDAFMDKWHAATHMPTAHVVGEDGQEWHNVVGIDPKVFS